MLFNNYDPKMMEEPSIKINEVKCRPNKKCILAYEINFKIDQPEWSFSRVLDREDEIIELLIKKMEERRNLHAPGLIHNIVQSLKNGFYCIMQIDDYFHNDDDYFNCLILK